MVFIIREGDKVVKGRKIGAKNRSTYTKIEKLDQLAKQGYNANQAAKILNMSTRDTYQHYQKSGYKITPFNKKYSSDESIFEIIDTEEKAYWLGFLYADGNVRVQEYINGYQKRGYTVELRLHVEDIRHLYAFKEFTKTTSPIKYEERKSNGLIRHQCILQIHSKKMCEDLIKWGCIPRKSLILNFPKELPDELTPHFVRGYFDGDGHIKREERYIELIGTKEFLSYIVNYFSFSVSEHNYYMAGKAYCFRLYGTDVQKFIDNMYSNATIYLDRKYYRCMYIREKFSHHDKLINIAIKIYAYCDLPLLEILSITGIKQTTFYRHLQAQGVEKRRLDSSQRKDICVVEGCHSKTDRRNLCSKHYTRWYRYGDVSRTKYKRNRQ
jgi:hypothetical protein